MTTTAETRISPAAWHAAWKRRKAGLPPRSQPTPVGPKVDYADVIGDIDLLARSGETLENTARRVGYRTETALRRALNRHRRSDLIRQFAANKNPEANPW